MNLKYYVQENQKVINLVKDKVPGNSEVDMYYGTLDYATARFHTILLKIIYFLWLEVRVKWNGRSCVL